MSAVPQAHAGLETFIRPGDMPRHVGGAMSTVYAAAADGLLPPPVKLFGRRASGFIAREVAAVQRARIAGKTEDEIRSLVADLVKQRSASLQ